MAKRKKPPPNPKASDLPQNPEFQEFTEFTRRLMSVTKEEIADAETVAKVDEPRDDCEPIQV